MPIYQRITEGCPDGLVCVKTVKDMEELENGAEYVDVNVDNNGLVTSAVKQTKSVPQPPLQQLDEAADAAAAEAEQRPGAEQVNEGGFSMKSLSRGLFGSKKSKKRFAKRSFKKSKQSKRSKRSGRKYRSTRRK